MLIRVRSFVGARSHSNPTSARWRNRMHRLSLVKNPSRGGTRGRSTRRKKALPNIREVKPEASLQSTANLGSARQIEFRTQGLFA